MGSLVGSGGDKVAIVEPDYFANRKIVEFFDGVLSPVTMDYLNVRDRAGLDLTSLEKILQRRSQGLSLLKSQQPYRRYLFR